MLYLRDGAPSVSAESGVTIAGTRLIADTTSAVSAFGLYASHWGAVIGALLEFLTGVSLFQLANARRKRRSE